MGINGDTCVLERKDLDVLVDLAFKETQQLVNNKKYGFGSREQIAEELQSQFGLTDFDLSDIFFRMDRKYKQELYKLGVMMPNPEYL